MFWIGKDKLLMLGFKSSNGTFFTKGKKFILLDSKGYLKDSKGFLKAKNGDIVLYQPM